MTDAKLPVQTVVIARCIAALTTLGYSSPATRVITNPIDGQEYPYVVVGEDEQQLNREATDATSDANTVEHLVRVYHTSLNTAKTIGAEIITEMTDRNSPPAPDGWTLYEFTLDFDTNLHEEATDAPDVWGRIMRFRLVLEPTT